MTATGTAEPEKVVRKVFDDELGDDSEATYACAVGVVVKNHGEYPGNPPERRWHKAAARNVLKTCL